MDDHRHALYRDDTYLRLYSYAVGEYAIVSLVYISKTEFILLAKDRHRSYDYEECRGSMHYTHYSLEALRLSHYV